MSDGNSDQSAQWHEMLSAQLALEESGVVPSGVPSSVQPADDPSSSVDASHAIDALQTITVDEAEDVDDDGYLSSFDDEEGEFDDEEVQPEEFYIKEEVSISLGLSARQVYYLFLLESTHDPDVHAPGQRRIKDHPLFEILISKQEDWLNLAKSTASVRHLVYSICRTIITSDRKILVKGTRLKAMCLMNLMYDVLFMANEHMYPTQHDFPDCLPRKKTNVEPRNTFALHDFCAEFSIGPNKSRVLTVKFDLAVLERAIGPVHTSSQRKNVTRVPLPAILSVIFPGKKKQLAPFLDASMVKPGGAELQKFLAEKAILVPQVTGYKRKAPHVKAKQKKTRQRRGNAAVFAAFDALVAKKDAQTSPSFSQLYICLDQITIRRLGYWTCWFIWYCPYNGQLMREAEPAVVRQICSFFPGGVLVNVPAKHRVALLQRMVLQSASQLAGGAQQEEEAEEAEEREEREEREEGEGQLVTHPPVQHVSQYFIEEVSDEELDLSATDSDADDAQAQPAQMMRVVQTIDTIVPMLMTNATLLVCHAATKLAWISELSKCKELDVVPLSFSVRPTVAQIRSFKTVFVVTYIQCSRWHMNPDTQFRPLSCDYHRVVFDDTQALQLSDRSLNKRAPFLINADVRWSFLSVPRNLSRVDLLAGSLVTAINFYARWQLFTPQSLRLAWQKAQPLLDEIVLSFPHAAKTRAKVEDRIVTTRSKLTVLGQQAYDAIHKDCNMCVSSQGEPWTTARTDGEYRQLMKKSAQSGAMRLKKKQHLLSEADMPLLDIKQQKCESIEADKPCCICFEDLEVNKTVLLTKCSHRMCIDCQSTCSKRRLNSCPLCRATNTVKQRRLLVNDDFNKATIFPQATTKIAAIERLVATGGVVVVVYRTPATCKFLTQILALHDVPVSEYSSITSIKRYRQMRSMSRGVILVSNRMLQLSLLISDAVKAVVFFEPDLDHAATTKESNVAYLSNWSCEDTARKVVLFTGKTLEEEAVKHGKRTVKLKQRPEIVRSKSD